MFKQKAMEHKDSYIKQNKMKPEHRQQMTGQRGKIDSVN